MSHRSELTESPSNEVQGRHLGRSTLLSDYWALTKPEVNFLILITTVVGFYMASTNDGGPFSFAGLFNTLLGTLLVASGTGALNQYLEREFDAQMRRTARRPAAAGRLAPSAVLTFGTALAVIGSIYLATTVNLLASVLATLTLLTYLFLYTPLKRKTPLCVLVGAFPGAMPPLIGWAAASGRLNIEAGILYAMLFLWQFPHFMAIAWLYREDYDRAGYLVLPQGNARVPFVMLETVLPLFALVAISIMQSPARHVAIFHCAIALLGIGFTYFGLEFVFERSRIAARRLLTASILYLPLLYGSATLCNRARCFTSPTFLWVQSRR
jgi:protoheme IX farnesyltransferase